MQIGRQLKTKQIKTDLHETLTVLGGFLLALLLSRVRIHSNHLPFALGMLFGCSLAGIEIFGALGGVVLGAIVCTPVSWHTICAAILFAASLYIVQWMKKPCGSRIKLLLYGASGITALPLVLMNGTIELLYGAISVLIAAAFGICMRSVIRTAASIRERQRLTDGEQVMAAIAIGVVLLAGSEAQLFGWSASVSLLIALTAFGVSARGICGAVAGTFWASILVLYTGADPGLIGCIALGSTVASVFQKGGKPMRVCAMLLSAFAFQTFRTEGALAANLENLLCGTLLYLLTPKAWIERARMLTDESARSEQKLQTDIEQIERNTSDELIRIGNLLRGFAGMFHVAQNEDEALRNWTMQGALRVCRGCKKQPVCWEDVALMQDTILSVTEAANGNKRCEPIEPIDPACRRFRDLVSSALLSYQQAMSRDAVCMRAKQQAQLIDRQFTGIGSALCDYAKRMCERSRETGNLRKRIRDALAEEGADVCSADRYETNGVDVLQVQIKRPLRITRKTLQQTLERTTGTRLRIVQSSVEPQTVSMLFETDADLHASMRVFRAKGSLAVSGDAAGECRMLGGHVCFALSDGMGSGETARTESEAAIDLLFRLQHAGIDRELIYENVNRLLLANNDTEMYATLDAVLINLNTGEAEVLKYGAPPSYLVRNGRVRPIGGEALPCGILAEARPSVIRMKLKAEDRLVLCSDGVQDVLAEGAEQAIHSVAGMSGEMGERLLKLAESRGGTDDKTVMVIRVA